MPVVMRGLNSSCTHAAAPPLTSNRRSHNRCATPAPCLVRDRSGFTLMVVAVVWSANLHDKISRAWSSISQASRQSR